MKLNDTHKKIASLLFSILMITTVFFVAFIPSVVATDRYTDADFDIQNIENKHITSVNLDEMREDATNKID